jgi:hypothetical protein
MFWRKPPIRGDPSRRFSHRLHWMRNHSDEPILTNESQAMSVSRLLGLPDDDDPRDCGVDPYHDGDLEEPCEICSRLIGFKRRIQAMERWLATMSRCGSSLRRELHGIHDEYGDLLDEYGHVAVDSWEIRAQRRGEGAEGE